MALLAALLVGAVCAIVLLVVTVMALSRNTHSDNTPYRQGKTLWSRTDSRVTEAMKVDLVDHRIKATAEAGMVDLEGNNLSSSCVMNGFLVSKIES
jgi:hypothetical protein